MATMERGLMDRAIISGIGQTEFSKDAGRSLLQLAAEATIEALDNAGLQASDIDGLVTFTLDGVDEQALMNTLGIQNVQWASRTPYGGGGSSAVVQHAAAAVATGMADHVLVYRALNQRGTRGQRPAARSGGRPTGPPGSSWTAPFGIQLPAAMFALWYQGYMDKAGMVNEDLGRYTVVARKHAAKNPNAWFYERPITLEDHQASRWIVEPVLRLLDCCQQSDGAVAVIVSAADVGPDLPHRAVTIRAAANGLVFGGETTSNYYHRDFGTFPESVLAAEQLWAQSGLTHDDIDVAMIYENFSPVVFMQLETLGFCEFGEAKDFVADGHIELGGKLPLNTHGGLLGEAYIHGVNNILEAVRQLRGQSCNQVPDAEHVLVSSGQSALILGGA